MKCKEVQEYILSDYTDGELGAGMKKKIDEHLAGCEKCRAFQLEVQTVASGPLREAEQVEAPEELWSSIRSAIEEGAQSPVDRLIEGLHELLAARKPALVAAALVLVVVTAGIFARTSFLRQDTLNTYFEEQTDYYDFLKNGYKEPSYGDLGIPLEDLFL